MQVLLLCKKLKGTAMAAPHPLPFDLRCDKSNAKVLFRLEVPLDIRALEQNRPKISHYSDNI